MGALVLGLVVSEAAGSYFAQRDELKQVSAKLVLLDRMLSYYGPEAGETRDDLRRHVARNATVFVTLFLCAVFVAGATLLIVELYKRCNGLTQISSAPLRSALAQLGK